MIFATEARYKILKHYIEMQYYCPVQSIQNNLIILLKHHKLWLRGEEIYFTNTDIGKGDPPDSTVKQNGIR